MRNFAGYYFICSSYCGYLGNWSDKKHTGLSAEAIRIYN